MVEYKIVKYCVACKARFVVDKKDSKVFYCDNCQKKYSEVKQ